MCVPFTVSSDWDLYLNYSGDVVLESRAYDGLDQITETLLPMWLKPQGK